MFAISEQEKLDAYFEVYSNIKYNIAKKRRELELTREMTSLLSGVSIPTLNRIEQFVSETQDIRLSSLIDVCTLFGMTIQEVFEPRPDVVAEQSEQVGQLLNKPKVSPSDLPEELQNDFANYIGDEKFVDKSVFAAWYRIFTLKNHGEPKEKLQTMLARKIESLEVGESHNYKSKSQHSMYFFIKKLNNKEFKLRYVEPETNSCTRIK